MLGSLGASLWKQWRDHELVESRIGIQETGANLDRECSSNNFQFTVKGEDEIEITNNVVHSFRERENLHKIHERKVDSAVRGEIIAQQKLCEAEQKLRREIGRREILTAHFRRTIKNLNLKDFSYTKQLDGQIGLRGTRLVCVENEN